MGDTINIQGDAKGNIGGKNNKYIEGTNQEVIEKLTGLIGEIKKNHEVDVKIQEHIYNAIKDLEAGKDQKSILDKMLSGLEKFKPVYDLAKGWITGS